MLVTFRLVCWARQSEIWDPPDAPEIVVPQDVWRAPEISNYLSYIDGAADNPAIRGRAQKVAKQVRASELSSQARYVLLMGFRARCITRHGSKMKRDLGPVGW